MKKDLSPRPNRPGGANLLAAWASAALWAQITAFWLAVILGAVSWAGLLWLVSGRPAHDAISPPIQALYVLGLYAWLLGLSDRGRMALNLPFWQISLKRLTLGAVLGTLCYGLLVGLALSLDWAGLRAPAADWPVIALQVIAMALAVAWIEERVFRGLLLDLSRRQRSFAFANGLQALLYALVHLLRGDLGLWAWLNALASLWLTGLILGRVRRGADLGASLGMHAAWVALSSFMAWAQVLSWHPESALYTGNGNPVYGLSGLVLLACLQGALMLRSERRDGAQGKRFDA